jgi:hypothetical protein
MLSLLRDDGWRRLVRPIDGKEFVNDTVEQWVLGEPWAGLHFPSWDALYAMLDRSEHGPECRERLIALGAPANGAAADARPVARSGRPKKGTKHAPVSKGGSDRIAARLKESHQDLAEEVIAGRLSAHAAAVQAGFRKPTWTASVAINAGITGMSRAAETPREEWSEILYLRRRLCERVLPNDCRALLFFIEDGRASGDFMGYGSEERYLREGLGIADTDAALWAVRGLQLLNQEVPVAFADAVVAGKRVVAAAQATTADVVPMKQGQRTDLPNLGKSQEGRAADAGVSRFTQQKLDALARRAPSLLDEVRAGRLSAHAAAVKAGIVAPTWTAPADPERLAQAIDKRLPGWRLARATDPDTGPSRPEAQAHAPDRVSPIPSVATDADLAVTVYGDPSSWPVRLQGPLQRAVEDCGWFAHLARQLKLCASWRQVAPDWSLFCEQKLGHPAPFVDAVIAGAQALGEKVDPSGDAQYRADAATLPARGRARLEKLEAQLRAMFDDEVQRRVQQELRERHRELVAQLEAERDAYIKKHLAAATMKASMHAILSESDYRLLLSVRPSHESRSKSSLAIRELPDGRVLVRDFGGCDVEDVLGAVGLTFADLYPETIDTSREAGGDRRYRSRERLPFDAGALLRALHADVLMAATIVSRALDNSVIDDAERDALWRCAGRLAEAVEALDGRC